METFIRHKFNLNNDDDFVRYFELKKSVKKYGLPTTYNFEDILIEKWYIGNIKIEFSVIKMIIN